VHEPKDVERYGRALFDIKTRKIVALTEVDSLYNRYPMDIGVFAMAVDPLTKGYPMLTPYQYASNNPILCIDLDGLEGVSSTNRAFINEVGVKLYKMYRAGDIEVRNRRSGNIVHKREWSVRGSIFVYALTANESGYGQPSAYLNSKKYNNYWGMGDAGPGRIKYKSLEEGYGDFVYHIYDRWPEAAKLFESGNFTTDKMNKALRSGPYVSSYSYNTDIDETTGEYIDYASYIFDDIAPGLVKRTIIVIDEQVEKMDEQINVYETQIQNLMPELMDENYSQEILNRVTVLNERINRLKSEKQELLDVKSELESSNIN
jgi:hypothetical protein